ncbi:glycosyltransferase family 4 protein [Massilimicrobiota timonensis]|uniref:glycosyltransferase family 4 protein n=1 Tax=Massilimicrobiota timonensis TaxID=1776392 RepID=UPI0019607F67|nr:glycosyltransferase family 4 protein [Massilimicrobiota timonensis]MBM6966296.1 glycosyltransferase family 4 protein [Massilimicrobiota timonensis]
MKKIGFIIGSMVGGGAERVISVISEMFVNDNYEVHLIIFRKTEDLYHIDDKINVHFLSCNEGKIKRNITLPWRLIKKINEINADLYISFCILENCLSCFSKIFIKNKLVISERNAPNNEILSFHLRVMRKLFYRFADGIVFQTNEAKFCYSKKLQKKGEIIPNPLKDNLPEKTDYDNNYKIAAIGRLAIQKNYPMLLNAFSHVLKEHPEYELHIFGVGPLEDSLKQLVIDLGIDDSVVFKGFSKNIHNEILNYDMYVMTSDYEGMPNSLMEAMAIGVPSISTNCPSGGPKVLITNNENGILVPVNDYLTLSKKMNMLIKNYDERSRIGENSKKIRQKYSRDSIYKLWKIYTSKFL